MLLLVSISAVITMYLILFTLMSEVLLPWGYTDADASNYGFWGNVVGIAGGVVAAIIISKTQKYKLTSTTLIIMNIIGAIVF